MRIRIKIPVGARERLVLPIPCNTGFAEEGKKIAENNNAVTIITKTSPINGASMP
jgi:hypothetical protein